MKNITDVRNARYLESGAVDCEVMFDGMNEFIPYTAAPDDIAETGRQVWQELQNGKYEITPFKATREMIEAARSAKRSEIAAWRAERELQPFTVEWNGRRWNAGTDSLSRLFPAALAAKSNESRTVLSWGDADNNQVPLSMAQIEELAAVMARAQIERNDEIYQRQREMKDELEGLEDISAIRAFSIE